MRASGQPLVVVSMGPDSQALAQRVGQEVICVDTACQETLDQLLSAMMAANPALLVIPVIEGFETRVSIESNSPVSKLSEGYPRYRGV